MVADVGAEGYGWSDGTAPHSTGYIAPVVLRVLRDLGARRVLDLGAGNGSFSARLSAAGHDVVGVEVDPQGVAIARGTHKGLRFHQYSVDDAPAQLLRHETVFDAVVSTEVIEHLYAPHHLVQYAHAVLRDDGWLIVTTPYHGYLKNLALSIAGRWDHHHTSLWLGGHVKFFSRTTLSSLLHAHGFEVVRFVGIGRLPLLWKSMLLVARKRR